MNEYYNDYKDELRKSYTYPDTLTTALCRIELPSDSIIAEKLVVGRIESKTTPMFKNLRAVNEYLERHECISPLAALFG